LTGVLGCSVGWKREKRQAQTHRCAQEAQTELQAGIPDVTPKQQYRIIVAMDVFLVIVVLGVSALVILHVFFGVLR